MSTALEDMIQREIAAVRIHTDKESSMLKEEERAAAARAVKRVIDKYKPVLEARGGVHKVYEEMTQYLAGKIGNSLSATDPIHRQGLNDYSTALRTILDPEACDESGSKVTQFGSVLHAAAKEESYPYSETENIPFKELLAYYWLAASDQEMSISDEQLAITPGDTSQEKREKLVEGEKENLIRNLASIRRAHNGDPGRHSEDSIIDEPSCIMGTFGRIVSSPISNLAAKMEVSPVQSFPMDIEVFIFNKFQEAGKEVSDSYAFCSDQYFVMGNFDETEEAKLGSEKYKQFIDKTEKSKDEFLAYLEGIHGKKAITPQRREIAEKLYETTINSLKFFNAGTLPKMTLIEKLNKAVETAKKKEIFDKTKLEIQEKHISFYQKISSNFSDLAKKVSALDLDELSNDKLNNIISEVNKEHNDIIFEKEKGDKGIRDHFIEIYIENLQTAELNFSESERAQLSLRKLYDDNGSTDFVKSRAKFDASYAQFLGRIEQRRIKEMEKLLAEEGFQDDLKKFIEQAKLVKNEIESDISSIEKVIKGLDEGSKPQDISQYTGGIIKKHLESNDKIYKDAVQAFLAYCEKQGLKLSLKEFEELDKNLGIRKTLNLEENEKMLEDLNSKINTLKKEHLRRDILLETQHIASGLRDKIDKLIDELIKSNPAKNSREQQQLNALQECRTELTPYTAQRTHSKTLDLPELIKKAERLSRTIKRMELKFENIGYPGKLKTFVEAAKNKCTELLNHVHSLFGLKGKAAAKSLTKEDINKVTAFTSAFDAFKNKIKSETQVLSSEPPRPNHPSR